MLAERHSTGSADARPSETAPKQATDDTGESTAGNSRPAVPPAAYDVETFGTPVMHALRGSLARPFDVTGDEFYPQMPTGALDGALARVMTEEAVEEFEVTLRLMDDVNSSVMAARAVTDMANTFFDKNSSDEERSHVSRQFAARMARAGFFLGIEYKELEALNAADLAAGQCPEKAGPMADALNLQVTAKEGGASCSKA